MISIKKVTDLAHYTVSMVIKEGDQVIDATAGNGHDTVFLAEKTGPTGHVYAFDIQEEALKVTAEKLKAKDLDRRVTLIRAGHEDIAQHVDGPVAAVMYNLGYLPGGSRQVKTGYKTTLRSFEQALTLLKPGGIVTLVLYPGHPEGRLEKEELLETCTKLPSPGYTVLHTVLVNQANEPPEMIVVQKILFTSS